MAHEYFDRFEAAFALKTQRLTHFLLFFESQLILVFAGRKMQLVADSQEEIMRGLQFRDIRRVDDALGRQLIEIFHLHFDPRHPTRGMDIPQPSLALLDVRFQQINRTAVAGMPCVVFGELFADKSVDPFSGQAALDGFFKFVVEGLVTADVSAIE